MATVSIPLAVPADLLEDIRRTAQDTGLSQADVMRQSMKAGLPKVRKQFKASSRRVTNVDPLPRRELEKFYSRPDELDGISGDQLASFQSREEPS